MCGVASGAANAGYDDGMPTPRVPIMTPRAALALGTLGFALEIAAILPIVDRASDENATLHFSQHGMIFLGGILLGWALRDLRLASLFAARR